MMNLSNMKRDEIVGTMITSGFGSDKYIEVNRIMATRTREYGGCMVARSQMHAIVEQDPMLDRTVEQKYHVYYLQIFICDDFALPHHPLLFLFLNIQNFPT